MVRRGIVKMEGRERLGRGGRTEGPITTEGEASSNVHLF